MVVAAILPVGFGDRPLLSLQNVEELLPPVPVTLGTPTLVPGPVQRVARRSLESYQSGSDEDEAKGAPLRFGYQVRQQTQDTLAPWHPDSEDWIVVPSGGAKRRWALKSDD